MTLAVLAYLLREARARGWPTGFTEALVATIVLFAQLANEDANAPESHIALAGGLQLAQRLYADSESLWGASGDVEAAARWQRDAVLFNIAGSVRQQRTARAWERLGAEADEFFLVEGARLEKLSS